MRFENKKVLVTGASSGIGKATALLFAQEGADIAFTYNKNESGAKDLETQLKQLGRQTLCLQIDMTDNSQIDSLAQRAENELGPIDILINNAGGLVERMLFFDITPEKWDEIMKLNLWSVLYLSQKIGAKMKERESGIIVLNSSVAGRFGGGPGALTYGVAKGALITMTQAMGRELIPFGIRVNGVAPGLIDTPFHDRFTPPDVMEKLMTRVPIGRQGTSEEMAKVIAFLASDDSSYLVGVTIDANGGMWAL